MKIQHFRYVAHERVNEYESVGWVAHDGLIGTIHGQWSTLMEWLGEGEVFEPGVNNEANGVERTVAESGKATSRLDGSRDGEGQKPSR